MRMTTEALIEIIALLHRGERVAARERFAAVWQQLAADDWFHRCVLAHYMADAQDSVLEELTWDERALQAAEAADPGDFDGRFPEVTLASFYPSLHLNVASCLERLGRKVEALDHARRADRAAIALGTGPLAKMTRDGIANLLLRLHSAAQS